MILKRGPAEGRIRQKIVAIKQNSLRVIFLADTVIELMNTEATASCCLWVEAHGPKYKSVSPREVVASRFDARLGSAGYSQTGALPESPPTAPHEPAHEIPFVELAGKDDPVLTLEEAIHIATNRNPQYQIAKFQALQSYEQYKSQRSQYFPTLYTFALYTEPLTRINISIPAGAFGTFPTIGPVPGADLAYSTPRKPLAVDASYASQPLTSLIRLHYSINSQRLMAESQRFRAEQTREQQIISLKQAYTRVQNSELQVQASSANVRASRETARVAHARRDQGAILLSQLENADAQLASAESQEEQDLDTFAQNKERLNQMLGRDVMTAFRTSAVEDLFYLHDLPEEELRAMALRNRPELKQDTASIQANELQVKATRAMYIPDVSASAEYLGVLSHLDSGFPNYGFPHNFAAAGVQLAWSPWDWGQKKHLADAQRASVKQSQVQRDQDQNQIIADVNQAARIYRQRRTQLRAMELSAKAARTNLQEVQKQVENGTALMTNLLQAQSGDTSAQSQLATARNNLHDAEAQLEQAVGEVQ